MTRWQGDDDDPLTVAVNSARVCIERFRVRPESTHLLETALRELDDAMAILRARSESTTRKAM